jgi:hypothetical protein
MNFLMIDGTGSPNNNPAYSDAVGALYAIAYYLKYQTNPEMYREKIQAIIDYNEDDCRATKRIKDWLQEQLSSSI